MDERDYKAMNEELNPALRQTDVSSHFTPKEKAWELWNYYGTLLGRYDKAAEAAIKVVDEMHNFMRTDDEESDTCYWANHKMSRFWSDVEIELRKLS
jgi:hypothetical protein